MDSLVSTALEFRVGSIYHVQRDTVNTKYIKLVFILIYKVIVHQEIPIVVVLLFCFPGNNNNNLFKVDLNVKEKIRTLNVT